MSRPERRPDGLRALFPVILALGLLGMSSCVDGTPTEVVSRAVDLRFGLQASERLSSDEQDALRDAFDRLDQIRIELYRDGDSEPFVDTLIAVVPGQASYVIELSVETLDPTASEVLQVALTGSAAGVELFSARGELTIRAGDTGVPGTGGNGGEPAIDLEVRYTGPGLRGAIVDALGGPAAGIPVTLFTDDVLIQSTSTSADGEYLFTDLEPGTYRIVVEPSGGLVSCPADRIVGPLTEESSVVGAFRLSAGDCELRVLALSGGDVDDNGGVVGGLSARIPHATFGSFFVVVGPPTLEMLLSYDVVLLYENGTYADADRVGNRVAEYVAAGGNVVFGGFYWQNRSDGEFNLPGWGALEGIDPFASNGRTEYGPGSLGSTVPHPITAGVNTVTVPRWWGGATAKGGTAVVATWSDGTPLAGHKTLAGGQRLVAVSAFPGLTGGDLGTLWANAVTWAGSVGGPSGFSARGR